MHDRSVEGPRGRAAAAAGTGGALLCLLIGLGVWLWPIGFGGRMPVGGDVTQFSLGLMAVFARSIRALRLPVWNDLWGYGFPGLAESQMGVYYPPHLILYGRLPLEAAYTVSLVAHTFWGGLGAFWAARRFGVSHRGSALAGFAWGACGFFLIHLPHQWGYTVGSWMPWAWGLAWVLLRGEGSPRTPCWLALVLTLQVLPGHFQLAFCTQVGVLLLALGALTTPSGRSRAGVRRTLVLGLALAAVVPLGALQLWPTWRLAQLAESRRDYEYLSGFASTPVHLLSYVAPRLFHVSPLWRPVGWDPFRTSPEEHLAYVGLVPLFLALGAVARQFRREPATRVLALVALATLVLSLGPYIPGFSYLIRLPGISFFRAPARWSLATALALCLLAGRGFDAVCDWPGPGRSLRIFAVAAAVAPWLAIGMLELALASTERPGFPALADAFARAARLLPTVQPETTDFPRWMNEARRLQNDLRVRSALARQGIRDIPDSGLRFSQQRWSIYCRELGGTAALLAALLALALLARRRRVLELGLLGLTVVDLWSLAGLRTVDFGPIRALTEQSTVLTALQKESTRARTVDPAKNLPMVAAAEPLLAYRTLDLPAVTSLAPWLSAPLRQASEADRWIVDSLRAAGASVRILDPFETLESGTHPLTLPGWERRQSIHDPALAGWLYGTDWVAGQDRRAATFTLWRPVPAPARAWRVSLTGGQSPAILVTTPGEPGAVWRVLDGAEPLDVRSPHPERLEISFETASAAAVIVSQLADPQWQARWRGGEGGDRGGQDRPAAIVPVFTRPGELGWQAVAVPGPGRWTLHLEYDARDVRDGLIVSGLAGLAWLGTLVWSGRITSGEGGRT